MAKTHPSATPPATDITIVGGGMVGITLALLLAKTNPHWSIDLIETHPLSLEKNQAPYQTSFDARSTALAAGSVAILQRCDLWSPLQDHITPIQQVHVSDRGHFGGAQINAAQYGLPAVGYVVENAWLGRVLMQALAKQKAIRCIAPAQVKRLKPSAHGYDIFLEHAEFDCLHTQLAIIVDGASSSLAQSLGIQFTQKTYQQVALIANVESDQPHQGVAYERFTDQGPIALLPLGEGQDSRRHALVWTLPVEAQENFLHVDDSLFLRSLQQRFGYRQGKFISVGQRAAYPLHLIVAREQIRRNLVLMGNAAHFLHPVAGQGFNLALRDCAALCKTLRDAQQAEQPIGRIETLQSYVNAQATDQALTIRMSDEFVRWFSSDALSKSVLRNMGLFALEVVPGAGSLLAKQTMGMNVY